MTIKATSHENKIAFDRILNTKQQEIMYKMLLCSLLSNRLGWLCSLLKKALPRLPSKKDDVAVVVTVDGKLFTKYVYNDEKRAKPILYPVIGPNDIPMTRRYPLEEAGEGEAKDHPHHASLWYTHGEVNGISFWHIGKDTGEIIHEKFLKLEGNVIATRNKWVDSKGKVVCRDEREARFSR